MEASRAARCCCPCNSFELHFGAYLCELGRALEQTKDPTNRSLMTIIGQSSDLHLASAPSGTTMADLADN